MKKNWKKILIAGVALGLIVAGVLYFMDWGNATNDIEPTENIDPSIELENFEGTFMSSKDPKKSQIFFTIDGPKSAKGKFTKFTAKLTLNNSGLDDALLEVIIDPASVFTDNSTRDSHLRDEDFFHVEKYNKIVYTSNEFEKIDGDNKYRSIGKLEFLGKEWDFSFAFTYNGAAKTKNGSLLVAFEGEFSFEPEAYGMPDNTSVGDVANVSIYVEMIKGGDSSEGDSEEKAEGNEESENQSESFPEYEKDEYDKIFDQIEAEAGLETP